MKHTLAVDNSPNYIAAEDSQAVVAGSAPDHDTDHEVVTVQTKKVSDNNIDI